MHSSNAPAPYYDPGIPAPPMTGPGQWSTGLCDCRQDCSNCCLTCWCPCIPFGQMAEILDKGTTSCGVHGSLYTLLLLLTGCQCLYSCMYRSKMRQQYNLAEKPCNDCLVHCCCELCSLCQMYRELKHHGVEPSLGWEGNMSRENQGVMMPPAGYAGMKR